MQIYKISFINQGKVYQLYAKNVYQGDLYGFVEIEGLIFGENSSVVIDPGEEKLKAEFSGVERTMVPMHSVIRIDQVKKEGQSKIIELDGDAKVTPFPSSMIPPGKSGD